MSDIRTPEPLPPFSGLDASCRKCGDSPAKVTWHQFGGHATHPCRCAYEDREHMCRTCPCGYGWMEAPKDAGPAQEE